MARFTLQRVLELKKRHEEAMAVRLADARAKSESARRSEAAIDAIRRGGAGMPATAGGVPVGQLLNVSFLLERLDQRLDEAREEVRTAEAHEQSCLTELTAAMQDRRVLDRLKERRREEASAVRAQLDQITMDAIALTRFVRAEKDDLEGKS